MGNNQSTQNPVEQLRFRRRPPSPQEGNTFFTGYFWLILVALIALGVFLYTILYPAKATSVTKRGPYELIAPGNKRNEIFSTEDDKTLMINSYDEAIQFFVYLDGNLRMGQAVQTGRSGPSQETGMYQICPCNTVTDCTNCTSAERSHSGYQTVINIQDTFVLEVLNTPDASRPNAVSAQIYVKTHLSDGPTDIKANIETFPLPPIPEQKWTMITISKQGRQINVYFNSTLVLAKKAQNNFSTVTPTCSPVSIGSNSLSGKVAMITYFETHQTVSDVAARYQEQTDTRGNLNTMNAVPTSSSYALVDSQQSSFIKTLCLDLSCFNPGPKSQALPKIPPIYQPLDTQYA
jgi:hypothetical protein